MLAAIACLCALAGPAAAQRSPLLCVLVPHFKDEYWLSVAYGVERRAADRRARVRFFEAGGYRARERQIAQIAACEALRADAILIGAVTSDHPDLLAAVARAAERRPVVGLVNELHSDALAARIGVDWQDMGLFLGRHLAQAHPADGQWLRAILLSGPPESGWIAPLESGLRRGLEGSAVEIVAVHRADTGLSEQLPLLEQALAMTPEPDLIIGAAPAIEAAMALFADEIGRAPELVATYVSHNVARGIVGGKVTAAPYDDPREQGAMSVDAAVAALAGRSDPRMAGPAIRVLARGSDPALFDLSPADYFPLLD